MEQRGVSKAGSYATRILSITDIMQISTPLSSLAPARPLLPSSPERFRRCFSFTLQHHPQRRTPPVLLVLRLLLALSRRLALRDTLVPRATCESENELFTYLRLRKRN